MNAVRAEIRAIEKVGLAKEVHQQKLHEAQEIAEAVLDAEVKIGELVASVPKATPNNNPFHQNDTDVELVKPKSEIIKNAGLTQKQSERFQTLAKHPEAVEIAKATARENGDVVSRQSVMRIIAANASSPQKTPSLGQQAWEAKRRRQEFEEKRQEGVISMDDARNDLEDKKIISREIYAELQRITVKTHWLAALNKSKDFKDMLDVITQDQKERMTEYLETIIPILGYVLDLMKGVKS